MPRHGGRARPMTERDRDYEDGRRDAYNGDAADPARRRNSRYRDGARDGRAQRVNEELRAIYGDDIDREGTTR
jgi:hypothetical protein